MVSEPNRLIDTSHSNQRDPQDDVPVDMLGRLAADARRARWVIISAGGVFFLLAIAGRLSFFEALLAATLVAIAAMATGAPSAGLSRRAGERARRQRQQRPSYEQLIGAWPQPVILVDQRLTIRTINQAAGDLMEIRRLGDPLSFRLRDPDVLADVEAALANGSESTRTILEKVPSERMLRLHIRPFLYTGSSDMPYPTGKPGGGPARFVLIVIEDETANYRSERTRSDFVANASHELRTPLASISGCIETLQGSAKDDPAGQERFLSIMGQQADRMTSLIDDLLSLNRIEMRAHRVPTDSVDMDATVGEAIDLARAGAEQAGVSIELSSTTSPASVVGDAMELRLVVTNLLQNAIKYGGSGGKIDITLRDALEGGVRMVELVVRDYGPGIAPDHLPRLTERFYRAHEESSGLARGTGLGLAIVKHIVARHRGRLIIESEPGDGAQFSVRLPYAPVSTATSDAGEIDEEIQSSRLSHD